MTVRMAISRICEAGDITQIAICATSRKSHFVMQSSLSACDELFGRCAQWSGLLEVDSRSYPIICLVALPTNHSSNTEIG